MFCTLHANWNFYLSNREKQVTDIVLFKRVQADDRLALNSLFTTYYQKLCSFAYTYLKNPCEAEEIVADVFVNLWQHRHQLEIHKSFKSYIYISVRNACLKIIERKQPLFEDVEELLEHANWVSSDDPQHSIHAGELQYQIKVAVDGLPARCRQVFTMSRVNELTYQEISEILGISEKTVENHMVRALDSVRKSITRFERYEENCVNNKLKIM